MINEIDEMFEYIRLAYEKFINTGNGIRYAVARIFDEYDVYEDDDDAIVEDVITILAISELIINNESLYINTVKRIQKSFDNIDKFQAIIKEQITEIELQNLLSRIHKIENALTSVQITDNPRY